MFGLLYPRVTQVHGKGKEEKLITTLQRLGRSLIKKEIETAHVKRHLVTAVESC